MWRHVRTCKLCVQGGATSDAVSDGGHGSVKLVHLTLARRLSIPRESLLYSEAGWRVRVVLSWQRLVRAGKVRAARRCSPMWVAAERDRVHDLTAAYRAQTATEGEWRSDAKRARSQTYEWRAQAEVAGRLHVTSGAAAVIAQRDAASAAGGKRPRSPSPTGEDVHHVTAHGERVSHPSPRRDATLVVSPGALSRALCVTRCRRRVPRLPFGDG